MKTETIENRQNLLDDLAALRRRNRNHQIGEAIIAFLFVSPESCGGVLSEDGVISIEELGAVVHQFVESLGGVS